MKKIGVATLLVVFMVIPLAVFGQQSHDILFKKLMASTDDFVGKNITLECLFWNLDSHFLNGGGARYSPPAGERIYFSSTQYLGFTIWSATKKAFLMHLFIKKAKGEILYELNENDRITIRGKVTSSYNGAPWIEVYEIKKGWE